MKQFLILARYSSIEIINTLFRDKRRAAFIILIVMLPFMIFGSAVSSAELFKNIAKFFPAGVLLNFFAFMLFILFGFTASTNLFVTMKSVFNSTFIETLAPLPIKTPALFAAKIFEMLFFNYFDLAFCLPAFFAVAWMLGGGALIFMAAASLFIFFELLVCMAVLSLTLFLARTFSKRTAEFVTWCLSIFFVIAFIMVQNYPSKIIRMQPARLKDTFSAFDNAVFDFLPTKWLINVIYGLSSGDYGLALFNSGVLAALGAVLFFISYRLFAACFRRGVEAHNAVEKAKAPAGSYSYKSSSRALALLRKEYYCVVRNTQVIYSLLIMPVIFFIFTYLDISFGNMGAFTFMIFTSYVTATNSTLLAFGMEGGAIMVYKTLPLSIDKIFWVKFLVYFSLNAAAGAACFIFALKMSKIPAFIDPHIFFPAFMLGLFWLNLFVCDFGFYFANYKSDGKIKNAVRMEGTLWMIVVVFTVVTAAVASMYRMELTPVYLAAAALMAVQAALHYMALQNYNKGEF